MNWLFFGLPTGMMINYVKIAWRNLRKHKGYSLINLVGLASGMAITLLIGLWISDETGFDHYHSNHARLASVMVTQTFDGRTSTDNTVAIPLAAELQNKYADAFQRIALASPINDHTLTTGDKKISKKGIWAQPDLPVMLTLKMLAGSRNALQDPSSLLLSASLAKTLFGNEEALNKTLRLDNQAEMKVAGVYEDLPSNTTFHEAGVLLPWNKLVSLEPWMKKAADDWDNHNSTLFVQLSDGAGFDETTARIKELAQPHIKNYREQLLLHPMDKWRLYGEFTNGRATGGRIQFVWMFGIIGAFVLFLACINFMNLSTARSEKRAREVGIRKAMGSLRGQLIGQFLSESLVVAFLSMLLALGLAELGLPFFNHLADKHLSLPWASPVAWVSLLAFTVFTGLLAGSYPAFYLSAFRPVKVLKGNLRAGPAASVPRKVLVVVQFTVSVALIIGTMIIFRQIQFARDRPSGYAREGLLSAWMSGPLYNHYNAIRTDLLASGVVENVTESSNPVTHIYDNNEGFSWTGKAPGANPLFRTMSVTHDFGKTIGWQILEGRDFSRDFTSDSGAVILNEAAAALTGFKNPVGQILQDKGKPRTIVGVVKNILTQSPYEPMEPTIFFLEYKWTNVLIVKIKPSGPLREGLAKIASVLKKYDPAGLSNFQFADEEYAQKFEAEQRIGSLAGFFSAFAILISCLGLFGLASFVAEQRTKEIGVRKVLGASVFNLWGLLSGEFVSLVTLSCVIASPIAWYILHVWLQQYAYRTEISWWIFVAAGLAALCITLLTVSFQAIRAALMNPVKSLRTE